MQFQFCIILFARSLVRSSQLMPSKHCYFKGKWSICWRNLHLKCLRILLVCRALFFSFYIPNFFLCVWCRQYIEFQKIDNRMRHRQKWHCSLKCKFIKKFHLAMESNNVYAPLWIMHTTNLDIFFSFSFHLVHDFDSTNFFLSNLIQLPVICRWFKLVCWSINRKLSWVRLKYQAASGISGYFYGPKSNNKKTQSRSLMLNLIWNSKKNTKTFHDIYPFFICSFFLFFWIQLFSAWHYISIQADCFICNWEYYWNSSQFALPPPPIRPIFDTVNHGGAQWQWIDDGII